MQIPSQYQADSMIITFQKNICRTVSVKQNTLKVKIHLNYDRYSYLKIFKLVPQNIQLKQTSFFV